MFPKIFRFGPVAILQIAMLSTGIFSYAYTQITSCYSYAFIELSFQLFLIQMFFIFKTIKKDKKLRIKYISNLIFGQKYSFVCTIIWNLLTVWSVIIILLYWTILDGIKLTSINFVSEQSKICYSLYPLCLFSQLGNHAQSTSDFQTMIDFLYACTIFVNFVFVFLVNKQFYYYFETLTKNRKMAKQLNLQKSESLLDCRILNYSINQQQNDKNEDFVCSICLRKFCNQKIIQLKCQHYYHQECISIWLKVKDHCPYRCP